MIRYVFLDCEMGGRELRYSLLSVGLLVQDNTFNILGALDLNVKPDDGDYIVSGQGMGVNKIDLAQHSKIAIPYKAAKTILYNFLKEMSTTPLGQMKLTPIGHGVRGDIDHILKSLISEGSWEQFCTYHYIDTSVVLQYLRDCGKMPYNIDGSVGALAEYFGVTVDESKLHNSVYDADLTSQIYQKMVELGRK